MRLLSLVLAQSVVLFCNCKLTGAIESPNSDVRSSVSTGNPQGGQSIYPKSVFQQPNRPIQFCLVVDQEPYFGSRSADATSTIIETLRDSLKRWGDYIESKGLNNSELNSVLYSKRDNIEDFRGWSTSLAEKAVSCDIADLVIVMSNKKSDLEMFGLSYEDLVQKENAPVAFTKVSFNNKGSYWGKAVIWFNRPQEYQVAPLMRPNDDSEIKKTKLNVQWTDLQMLRFVFQHETGHLFGLPHIPRTIMAEDSLYMFFQARNDVLRKIELNDYLEDAILSAKIDWGHELQVRVVNGADCLSEQSNCATGVSVEYKIVQPEDRYWQHDMSALLKLSHPLKIKGTISYKPNFKSGYLNTFAEYELKVESGGCTITCTSNHFKGMSKIGPEIQPSAFADLGDTTILTFGFGSDEKSPLFKGEYAHYKSELAQDPFHTPGCTPVLNNCPISTIEPLKLDVYHNSPSSWAPIKVVVQPIEYNGVDPVMFLGVNPTIHQ